MQRGNSLRRALGESTPRRLVSLAARIRESGGVFFRASAPVPDPERSAATATRTEDFPERKKHPSSVPRCSLDPTTPLTAASTNSGEPKMAVCGSEPGAGRAPKSPIPPGTICLGGARRFLETPRERPEGHHRDRFPRRPRKVSLARSGDTGHRSDGTDLGGKIGGAGAHQAFRCNNPDLQSSSDH